jgi:hypothetical protein
MRKFFIVLIQIIIVIVFLRSDFAQHFFGGTAKTIVGWYKSIIEVPERSKIIALRDSYMRNNMVLKTHQVDYVIEVTDSIEAIDRFYILYCVNKDKNPYIFGENLTKLCSEIEVSELLSITAP